MSSVRGRKIKKPNNTGTRNAQPSFGACKKFSDLPAQTSACHPLKNTRGSEINAFQKLHLCSGLAQAPGLAAKTKSHYSNLAGVDCRCSELILF